LLEESRGAYGAANAYAGGHGSWSDIGSGALNGLEVGAVLGAAKPIVFGKAITDDSSVRRALEAAGRKPAAYRNPVDVGRITVGPIRA
jgi:hypothetical protein